MARIQRQMKTLIDHLATLGIEPLLDAKFRSNIAVNFRLPVGMPYKSISSSDGGAWVLLPLRRARATRAIFSSPRSVI